MSLNIMLGKVQQSGSKRYIPPTTKHQLETIINHQRLQPNLASPFQQLPGQSAKAYASTVGQLFFSSQQHGSNGTFPVGQNTPDAKVPFDRFPVALNTNRVVHGKVPLQVPCS